MAENNPTIYTNDDPKKSNVNEPPAAYQRPVAAENKSNIGAAFVMYAIGIGAIALSVYLFIHKDDDEEPAKKELSKFENITELTTAVDIFSLNSTDKELSKYGKSMEDWDVTEVTNFDSLFSSTRNPNMTEFNANVSMWNTTSAESMASMFEGASIFDADLSSWDTAKVKNMTKMFYNALIFVGTGLENWTVSGVEDMSMMFAGTEAFNADLSKWDLENITTVESMFENTTAFEGTGITAWKVGDDTEMTDMFCGATGENPFLFTPWSNYGIFC